MKQRLNEIKRMQQLAGIIVETKIGPKNEYTKLKSVMNDYFTEYGIVDRESFNDEMESGGDVYNLLAYDIAKHRGFEGTYDDLIFDNEKLNFEYNILATEYLRKYANEIFGDTFNETKVGPKQTSKEYILKVLANNGIDSEYLEDNDNEVEGGTDEWLDVIGEITDKDLIYQETTPEDDVKILEFITAMRNIGITLI